MKLLVANSCTNFVLSYPGGKDDVDNRTNETVIKSTANTPADSFTQSKQIQKPHPNGFNLPIVVFLFFASL